MADQFTNPQPQAGVGTNRLPLPPATRLAGFALRETNRVYSIQTEESESETLQLRSAAKTEVRSWKSPAKSQDHGDGVLEKKWAEASRSLKAGLRQARRLQSREEDADPAVRELQTSARLLDVALADSRQLPESTREFPEVETSEGLAVPRAYAAVAAYLRASGYKFQENSFVTFFSALQETQLLEQRELWALRPLTQLVLVEQMGRVARNLVGVISERYDGDSDFDEDRNGNAVSIREPEVPILTLVSCLRALDIASWREINEQISEVNRILRSDPCGAFPRMDSESRDQYLLEVAHLGKFSETEEPEIARRAIALARAAHNESSIDPRLRERRSHVGFYLVGEGRTLLEEQIHYRPPFSERIRKTILAWPEVYYLVGIELLTFAIIAFLLIGVRAPVSLVVSLMVLAIPVTEAASGVMNQLTVSFLSPRALPKLDFSEGIPRECSTLVVVPTLLLNETFIRRMAEELEIRFLANRDPHLYFALLTDAPDSPHRFDKSEGLVTLASNLIQELNSKYSGEGDSPFFLFHRFRTFNPKEGSWMGWERKRGKLMDLNELLRGVKDSFPVKVGDLSVLPKIRYVIPVDSDTQVPRGVARRLVATMAHPLNRPVIDPRTNTVVEGYGILQPRVGISVQSANRSLLASIYSGQTGFDFYTRAVSDIYQDLFGEGTFVGKGIYEVDVFRQVLKDRFPTNAILSHDLIEGTYTRAGLVSDVEVIDDYPTHFSAYSRRKHRWVRGDWQIIMWLFPRVPDALGRKVRNPLSLLSRWKIFDNLRRSLVEIATFVLLLAGWLSLPGSPRRWTLAVIVLLLIPVYLQLALSLVKIRPLGNYLARAKESLEAFVVGQINVFLVLAFLSHQTLVMLDAIIRTIVRVTITGRNLLEWETAAQAEVEVRQTPADVYLAWTPWLSLVIGIVLAICRPVALTDAWPLLVLWACAGPLARWLNRPLHPPKASLSPREEAFLRSSSLRTWRYFRESPAEVGTGLAPDNIQESPFSIAHRISPTNLGLVLNSQLSAYQLGYLTLAEFVREAERTLQTTKRLRRFRGHFLNWYDTETLEPLSPAFVSSVDSGNLACSLWTLKQGCLEALREPVLRGAAGQGFNDHLNLLDELAARAVPDSSIARALRKISSQIELLPERGNAWVCALPWVGQDLRDVLKRLVDRSQTVDELRWWTAETVRRAEALQDTLEQLLPWMLPYNQSLMNQISSDTAGEPSAPTLRSMGATLADLDVKLEEISESQTSDLTLRFAARALRKRLPDALAEADNLQKRLTRLAEEAEQLVQEMDFRFLYNPSRKLLTIGYDTEQRRADSSYYDLLASEARSAVFVAIAKGDIPQDSWLQLGRPQGLWNGKSVLLSWSGTMFEYLMPALWFEHRHRTILGETVRVAVECQVESAGKSQPWGISEAAFSEQYPDGHYKYHAFGVPFLALNPTSSQDVVVSPYSSFLALAVDPHEAVQNLQRLRDMGCLGELGFYDAVDFAPDRRDPAQGFKRIPCWMVHHQGMSLISACDLLTGGAIHKLFHSEPAVRATELLLDEKPPHTPPRVERSSNAAAGAELSLKGNGHDSRA